MIKRRFPYLTVPLCGVMLSSACADVIVGLDKKMAAFLQAEAGIRTLELNVRGMYFSYPGFSKGRVRDVSLVITSSGLYSVLRIVDVKEKVHTVNIAGVVTGIDRIEMGAKHFDGEGVPYWPKIYQSMWTPVDGEFGVKEFEVVRAASESTGLPPAVSGDSSDSVGAVVEINGELAVHLSGLDFLEVARLIGGSGNMYEQKY